MQVILQEKVSNLGTVGDIVDVKPGFARNFLLPSGKAVRATKDSIAEFEKIRATLEKRAEEQVSAAKARMEKIEATTLVLEAQASDEGKLFGSITPRDIADAAAAKSLELLKSEVKLPEGPIRAIGEHEVDIVFGDVHGKLKVEVKSVD